MYWHVPGRGHEDCQFRCSPTGGADQGLCHRQCGCCGLLQHQTTSGCSLQCQWLFQGNKVGVLQLSDFSNILQVFLKIYLYYLQLLSVFCLFQVVVCHNSEEHCGDQDIIWTVVRQRLHCDGFEGYDWCSHGSMGYLCKSLSQPNHNSQSDLSLEAIWYLFEWLMNA